MLSSPHSKGRLRVLTVSDMYPRLHRPQFVPFVEQQTRAIAEYCDTVVLSPTRTFPPVAVFRNLPSISRFRQAWNAWHEDLAAAPEVEQFNDLTVYRPRYNAPPKHVFHGVWGLFAYRKVLPLLRRLHAEQPFDVIHAHNAAPNGLIGILAKRWMKIPLVVSVHGIDLTHTIGQNVMSRVAIENVYQKADAVIAHSRATARAVVEHKANPANVHVVYYGGDGDMPAVAPQPPRAPSDPLRLLTVARLVEWKGIHWALAAVRCLVDQGLSLKYTIVGEGDYRSVLEEQVRTLNLTDVVQFTGAIPRSTIWEHFAKCDLFLLPSHWEAFGIVYIEALSQGKPIIGCTTGGAADIQAIYPDGVELTPPHDVAGVVAAVQKLAADSARRQRVQIEGPRLVAERFTWAHTAKETVALYQTLFNRPPLQVGAGVLHPNR